MRFDRGMRYLYADVGVVLANRFKGSKLLREENERLATSADVPKHRDWLKEQLKFVQYESPDDKFSVFTNGNQGLIFNYKRYFSYSEDRTLTVSWSCITGLMRDKDFCEKYVFSNTESDPAQPVANLHVKQESVFDYSQLASDESDKLRECETVIKKESEQYFTQLGKKFKEAQALLANHHRGLFEQWYTSLGFKKQTVYNLIQRYEYLSCPTLGQQEKEAFEKLPLTLSYEVSAPEAPKELVKKALSGDIKTISEYKKQKKELDSCSAEPDEVKNALKPKISESGFNDAPPSVKEAEFKVYEKAVKGALTSLVVFAAENPAYKLKARKIIMSYMCALEEREDKN